MNKRNKSKRKPEPVKFGVSSQKSLSKGRPKMNLDNSSRTIETAVSVERIKDIVSRYLAEHGHINKDECIVDLDLQYNNLKDDPNGHAIVPLIYTIEKN
jgi:hypothetical protein